MELSRQRKNSDEAEAPPSATPLPDEVEEMMAKEGVVFFDTALTGSHGSRSFLGEHPVDWLEGNLFDPGDFSKIERWMLTGAEKGWQGGLCGVVEYEGNFQLGVFPTLRCWNVRDVPCQEPPGKEPWGQDKKPVTPRNEGFLLNLKPCWDSERFCSSVRQLKEHILAGDVYQACLCYFWEGVFSGDAWKAYKRMRKLSPAPMAAFLQLPGSRTVLSASMERFLLLEGRRVETRPIKGTRARSAGTREQLERELLGSTKERAELTMITDLERNDLGQVCEFGSVRVVEHLKTEHYAQVSHLVSVVQGCLRAEVSHPEAFRMCFPGGSISGAPKKRALEILSELEARPRGIYTGAMGYFGFRGQSQWNIAIRTLVLQGNHAEYGVGAGIVADSEPLSEWEETLAKARSVTGICSHREGDFRRHER